MIAAIANHRPLFAMPPEHSSANSNDTRLHRQFQNACAEYQKNVALHKHPFFAALQAEDPALAAKDLCLYCTEIDPNRLLSKIDYALTTVNRQSTAGVAAQNRQVMDIVNCLRLFAIHRWLHGLLADGEMRHHGLHQEPPVLSISEELPAAVVAASWLDVGLRLQYQDGGRIQVLNLLGDPAEVQFGHQNLQQVFDNEIAHRVKLIRNPDYRRNPDRQFHFANILADLAEIESKHGMRLLFALGRADNHARADSALRRHLRDTWQVELVLYNSRLQIPDAVRDEWQRFADTVTERFESYLFPDKQQPGDGSMPKKLFISYAHEDDTDRQELKKYLKTLEKTGLIEVWDDVEINGGDDWYERIKTELGACEIAIMLISQDFVISDFIENEEVNVLLHRRLHEGIRVIPWLVKPAAYEHIDWLKQLQIRPLRARPISGFTDTTERGEQFLALLNEIKKFCGAAKP